MHLNMAVGDLRRDHGAAWPGLSPAGLSPAGICRPARWREGWRCMTHPAGRMRWGTFHRRIMPVAACGWLISAFLAWGGPARAGFSVCNDSFDVLNLAVAYDAGAGFVSEGWWTIAPNRCVAVIRDRILSRYVYVFATDVFNQALLAGDAAFCVDDGRFRIPGTDECWTRGHVAADFAEVDIGEAGHWTLILDGSGTPSGD